MIILWQHIEREKCATIKSCVKEIEFEIELGYVSYSARVPQRNLFITVWCYQCWCFFMCYMERSRSMNLMIVTFIISTGNGENCLYRLGVSIKVYQLQPWHDLERGCGKWSKCYVIFIISASNSLVSFVSSEKKSFHSWLFNENIIIVSIKQKIIMCYFPED